MHKLITALVEIYYSGRLNRPLITFQQAGRKGRGEEMVHGVQNAHAQAHRRDEHDEREAYPQQVGGDGQKLRTLGKARRNEPGERWRKHQRQGNNQHEEHSRQTNRFLRRGHMAGHQGVEVAQHNGHRGDGIRAAGRHIGRHPGNQDRHRQHRRQHLSGKQEGKAAVFIPKVNGDSQIKKVLFGVSDFGGVKNLKYLPFKFNLYTKDSLGYPDKPLLEKDILIAKKDSKIWTKVDVSSYNLKMPNDGVFIVFILLKKEEYKYKNDEFISSKIGAIAAVPALRAYRYQKDYIRKSYYFHNYFYLPLQKKAMELL